MLNLRVRGLTACDLLRMRESLETCHHAAAHTRHAMPL